MQHRGLRAFLAALTMGAAAPALAATDIQWWHAMTGANLEVVENLAILYEFCVNHLHGAGIKQDPAMVDEVVRILTTIRQGWAGVQARNG